MKDIGIYSGKVYDENEKSSMNECGVCVNDETAQSDVLVQIIHFTHNRKCNQCYRCRMSRESAGIKYSPYAEIAGMNIELVLHNIISASRIAGSMEANGDINTGNVDNNIEFDNFVADEFVKWYNDRSTSFEEYFVKVVKQKYGKTE